MAFLAVVAPGLTVQEARAASHVSVSVHLSVASGVVLTGDRVVVSGRVSKGAAKAPVRLQRYEAHRWSTVHLGRPARSGTYRFTFSSKVEGSWRLRVLSGTGRGAVGSRSFVLNVLSCTPGTQPRGGTAAWFTRPGLHGLDPIASKLSRLFCAAAPGASIDISMYFVRAVGTQPDVDPILTSLERVVRYRKVKVRIILEGRLYRPGMTFRKGLARLRRIATVVLCDDGCHNDRAPSDPAGSGIMHHKFITVSDMSWARGKDPAVVESSANWSQSQLANNWQSAVLLYDDARLYREFDVQFETLASCAAGCGRWSGRLTQLAISRRTYGLTDVANIWRDSAPAEREAAPGSGRGVLFSPWFGSDPLAVALNGYTCTAAHHSVLVDHMFITSARRSVLDALVGLKQRGCEVRIILNQYGDDPLSEGVREVSDAGLTVSCVPRVHDKAVLVDAVRTSDGAVDNALWMGSQSLGGKALRYNDEALLRVSTADATGASRLANGELFARFLGDWKALDRRARTC
jgi:hypothetical protein